MNGYLLFFIAFVFFVVVCMPLCVLFVLGLEKLLRHFGIEDEPDEDGHYPEWYGPGGGY